MIDDFDLSSSRRGWRPSRAPYSSIAELESIDPGAARPTKKPRPLPRPRPQPLPAAAAGPAPALALLDAWRDAWNKGMTQTARAALRELRKLAERPDRGGSGNHHH
jgi:hypothetical protein